MSTPDFSALVSGHRKYFQSGATRSLEWREKQLTALRAMMKGHAEEFYGALWTDLRTNARAVLSHSTRIDLGVRYPPYDRNKMLRSIVVPS